MNVGEHPVELLLEVVVLLSLQLQGVRQDVDLGLQKEVALAHQLQDLNEDDILTAMKKKDDDVQGMRNFQSTFHKSERMSIFGFIMNLLLRISCKT